jgi:hypothetical protein
MSARLLRPRSTGFHPEAQAWRNAVIANGGTVSGSTLTAVSNFCRSIDAAGIRDRFYRLNLFCGNGLSAALVPLYRGQSRTGTQFGNTTDTNTNFVSGDYVETGATGGLKGNAVNKSLNTGVTISDAPAQTASLSAYAKSMEISGSNIAHILVGTLFDAAGFLGVVLNAYWNFSTAQRRADFVGATATAVPSYASPSITASFLSASHTGGTTYALYENGEEKGSATATIGSASTNTFRYRVFARGFTGDAPVAWTAARMCSYHIGTTMTAAQHIALYDATQAFQTALGRQA